MDFKICGIIDIIIVVLFLLSALIGYKKGFIKKALGLVGLVVGLIVAFVFCVSFAQWLKETGFIYDHVYNAIYSNAESVITSENITNAEEAIASMGVGGNFIATIIAGNIPENTTDLATNIALYLSGLCINVISFILLFVGIMLIALILKIFANILRQNKFIRIIDGVLGIVLYCCIFILSIDIIFTIMRFLEPLEFFSKLRDFLIVDMRLDDLSVFRLSRYFYLNNPIYTLLDVLF